MDMLLLEVLLERRQQRDDEALRLDAHLRLRRHALEVRIRLALRAEEFPRQLRLDEHVGALRALLPESQRVGELGTECLSRLGRARHATLDLVDTSLLAFLLVAEELDLQLLARAQARPVVTG